MGFMGEDMLDVLRECYSDNPARISLFDEPWQMLVAKFSCSWHKHEWTLRCGRQGFHPVKSEWNQTPMLKFSPLIDVQCC